MTTDLWAEVVGQDTAVAQLHAAAAAPIHAYLLVGPEGSGTREAARAFAADLLAPGTPNDELDLLHTQIGAEAHPALHVVEREGASISADQAREVVTLSVTSPPEGGRRVFLIVDAQLLGGVGPMLLKSIEEPPPSAVFILTAEDIPANFVTIESRCVRIDFAAIPESVVANRLIAEGIDSELAALAAANAGGSLNRARLLAGDPHVGARRAAWYCAPDRLDGTGAAAMAVVAELLSGIDAVLEPLAARQSEELQAFEDQVTAVGGKVRKGDLKALEARHAREQRRVRTDELRSGLVTLVSRYRDSLATGGDPAVFVKVADSVQALCAGLAHNPKESLAMQALFVGLPRLA